VIGEILLASGDHRIDGSLRVVLQSEIDHVTKHELLNAKRVLLRRFDE
jgi:hypothetical protein